MIAETPIILCDLGGTHARLGYLEGNQIRELEKYKIADMQNHSALFSRYCDHKQIAPSKIAVASAACHTQATYHSGFIENSKLTKEGLAQDGFELVALLNDFEASVWGTAFYTKQPHILFQGEEDLASIECLIGPGTGLGCAFMDTKTTPPYILPAWPGGNMRPCAATDEHIEMIRNLQKTQDTAIVYEDFVSGRGVQKIYEMLHGTAFPGTEEFIKTIDDQTNEKILRLFHEFLGLYIQNVIVTVGAGKVHLHGGLLDFLHENNLLHFEQIHKMIAQPYVESLSAYLQRVPITYINDTYLALDGLKAYLTHNKEGHYD